MWVPRKIDYSGDPASDPAMSATQLHPSNRVDSAATTTASVAGPANMHAHSFQHYHQMQ